MARGPLKLVWTKPPTSGGDDGGDGVEARLRKVEEAVIEISARLGGIEKSMANMATKGDLAEAKYDILKWMVGTMLAATGLAIAAIKLLP